MANTNRQNDADARALAANQKKQAAAAARKKERRNKILAIVATVLVVAVLGSLIAYSKLTTAGFFLRRTVSASSTTLKADNAVVSYFFHQNYQKFLSDYGYYLSYFGLDTSKSLKAQQSAFDQGTSWFDYFLSSTKTSLTQMLVLAEEATSRGLALDDDDRATVERSLANLKEAAKTNNVSETYYIHSLFGKGVNRSDVRRAMELSLLADKGYRAVVGEYSFGEADYQNYIKENPKALLRADYITMTLTTSDGMMEGDVSHQIINDYAGKLEATKTRAEFEAVAFDYLKNIAYKDDTDKTDDDIREEIEGFVVENATYSEGTELSEWLFDASRKVGDTYRHTDETTYATDVILVLSTAALDTGKTATVRHILISENTAGSDEEAKAKADALLAEWQSGAATEDSFAALAKANSEDSSAADGGLIENIAAGKTVEAFDAWIFDAARKAGDTAVVSSEYGYHVMYYVGEGLTAWEAEADAVLRSDKYSEDYAALQEKYPVTFDDEKLYEIDA